MDIGSYCADTLQFTRYLQFQRRHLKVNGFTPSENRLNTWQSSRIGAPVISEIRHLPTLSFSQNKDHYVIRKIHTVEVKSEKV